MATPIRSEIFNPLTGVFGTGQSAYYSGNLTTQTYTWAVPPGINACRVRLWGGGGYNGGSGGGFSLDTIYDLGGATAITVTVGAGGNTTVTTGGTSSFGSFVSATGGVGAGGAGGTGVGGDLNYTGGVGGGAGGNGGGCASLFGNGGEQTLSGAAGGGSTANGGNGALGLGGVFSNGTRSNNTWAALAPTTGMSEQFSIDFIGTGGGGAANQSGVNGGGGGGISDPNTANNGGFPGGGMGTFATITTGIGGPGLVIVEW